LSKNYCAELEYLFFSISHAGRSELTTTWKRKSANRLLMQQCNVVISCDTLLTADSDKCLLLATKEAILAYHIAINRQSKSSDCKF